MRNLLHKHNSYLIITGLLLISLVFPLFLQPSYANTTPKLEDIRVALFIDARGTVPAVTLSSLGGLHLGVRHPSGVNRWITHDARSPVQASVNQYKIHLLETNNYTSARVLAERVNGIVGDSYVMSQNIRGENIYRVYTGQFPNEAQAKLARDSLSSQSFLRDHAMEISGPLYWNAGTFNTEDLAVKELAQISANGIRAHLVYHENEAGTLVYSIWLGGSPNLIELDRVKANVSLLMPGLNLKSIDSSLPYLLKKTQMLSSGTTVVPYYFFNAVGQKVWINSDTNIQVTERSNRSYRGSIELSQYRDRLAVINQLPFEEYLYSVVGSEVSASWPKEALKAQAVAARTFSLAMGMKYGIAHVSDTTYEQAYYGAAYEFLTAIEAVEATRGEVIVDKKGIITAFYYSNAGGVTADTSEIWLTPLDYIKSVPSPDQNAEEGKLLWDRVVLPDGTIGYIRSDFTTETTEKNAAGMQYVIANNNNINVRAAPSVNNTSNPPIAQVNTGDRLIRFEQTIESNSYSWLRGPFTAEELFTRINNTNNNQLSGSLKTLEVTKRGPSGRVQEMQANGQVIKVSTPDAYRTVMNGLMSTRFDVEETGRYTVIGAAGETNFPENNQSLYILGGDNSTAQPLNASEMFVMNGQSEARMVTKDPQFRFIGLGFGHGIGMSQWGARELADFLAYDYKEILKYYYHEVSIVKD